MPADLFDAWREYARIKPFGHTDRLLAQLFARVVNMTRGEHESPVELADLIPIEITGEERREAELERELLKAMKRNRRK